MESIRITPSVLTEVAAKHDDVVGHVEVARGQGVDINSAVETYGAITHDVKSEVVTQLSHRDVKLLGHSASQGAVSSDLGRAVHVYTATDDENAGEIARLAD